MVPHCICIGHPFTQRMPCCFLERWNNKRCGQSIYFRSLSSKRFLYCSACCNENFGPTIQSRFATSNGTRHYLSDKYYFRNASLLSDHSKFIKTYNLPLDTLFSPLMQLRINFRKGFRPEKSTIGRKRRRMSTFNNCMLR